MEVQYINDFVIMVDCEDTSYNGQLGYISKIATDVEIDGNPPIPELWNIEFQDGDSYWAYREECEVISRDRVKVNPDTGDFWIEFYSDNAGNQE